jgi:hypothetical protein
LYSEHVEMVQMAAPWRHPQTGSFYIRRQIPKALRPCFCGKSLWQVSLRTTVPDEAKAKFATANAELEQPAPGFARRLDHDDCSAVEPVAHEHAYLNPGDLRAHLIATVLGLGFVSYVEALQKAGHTRLFPDLKSSTFDKLTKEASRLANRYIDRVGFTDPRLVFHSLRHTFKDLARDAGLQDSIIDQICGHAPTSTGGKYGRGARPSKVHAELNCILFDAVD